MCFIVHDIHLPQVKIAKKDIVCYKVVFWESKLNAYIPLIWSEHVRYRLGTVHKALDDYGVPIRSLEIIIEKLGRKDDLERYVVNEGIHSFKREQILMGTGNGVCLKCVIPKGAEYLENDHTYVSSQILPKERQFKEST